MGPDTQEALLPSKDGTSIQRTGEDLVELPTSLPKTCADTDEDGSEYHDLGKRESLAFLQIVGGKFSPRHSCTSLAWKNSRASFATQGSSPNMASRPSIASLKETFSRVNLELHPEKGSFIAYSMGQSVASLPGIAAKVYIITQVRIYCIYYLITYIMIAIINYSTKYKNC